MVLIYDQEYYDNRITKDFLTNNNTLFATKKIIFLFNILNHKHYIENKKFSVITYYFYNYYSIHKIQNKILDTKNIKKLQ